MESRQLITSGPLPPSQRRSWVSRLTTLWVVSWAVWMWWTVCLRRNIGNRYVCFSLCMYCVCWGEPHTSCMYSPSVCLQWILHCSITSPISNCVKLIHYHKDGDHSWTYFYSGWLGLPHGNKDSKSAFICPFNLFIIVFYNEHYVYHTATMMTGPDTAIGRLRNNVHTSVNFRAFT